jgi:dihydroneopterin aldolase
VQKLDLIRIDSLPVECVVGILPEERLGPQPLVVTVELRLDLTAAAESGQVTETVDYAAVAREVDFILTAGRFPLLETAALALCQYLATPPVENAKVTITKPRALQRVGVPSVTMERTPRYDFTGRGPVFAGPDAGVFRLKAATDPVDQPFAWSAQEDWALAGGGVLRVYRK